MQRAIFQSVAVGFDSFHNCSESDVFYLSAPIIFSNDSCTHYTVCKHAVTTFSLNSSFLLEPTNAENFLFNLIQFYDVFCSPSNTAAACRNNISKL